MHAARRDLKLDLNSEFEGETTFERWRCNDCSLIFFTPWQPGSSEFYSALSAYSWYQPEDKWEYQAASDVIGSGQRILDIGCGDGRFHKTVAATDYTGLESNMVPRSVKLAENAHIHKQTLEQHGTHFAGTYDAVCAFQVLEHVAQPRRFVEQALHCLKPNGLLILGMPNHQSYLGGLMNFALNSPPHHLTWWSDETLAALEQELRLRRVQLRHAPLEGWELPLYSMQRLYQWATPEIERYSSKKRWHWLIPMAYLGAKLTQALGLSPRDAQGSTMLWVATRQQQKNQ